MKAMLAESAIKSVEGLEKGASQLRRQFKPHAGRKSAHSTWRANPSGILLDRSSGVWIVNIFDIRTESSVVCFNEPTCYPYDGGRTLLLAIGIYYELYEFLSLCLKQSKRISHHEYSI